MTAPIKNGPTAIETIATHWGDSAPVWVRLLATACDETSQKKTAVKISRSSALVNQVLKGKYPGDLTDVQNRVEKVFGIKIPCPELGDIEGAACLVNQQKKYNPANHAAVSLFVACRRCPHNISCKGVKP